MRDVVLRLLDLSDKIGCRGLLIHAQSDEARDFYLRHIPEFEQSPTDDLHLVLLMRISVALYELKHYSQNPTPIDLEMLGKTQAGARHAFIFHRTKPVRQ